MGAILDDILALYRTNRRNGALVSYSQPSGIEWVKSDVTTTITDLLIDSISLHSQLLDSFVILHATLVASLHKLIGVGFGWSVSPISVPT